MVYEAIAVRYATVDMPKSELFHSFHSYKEPDYYIKMDYYFWILRNEQSVVVVDTGFDEVVGERRGRVCICPPLEAMRQLGVDPSEVQTLILTHFHYDHIGNASAFVNAQIIVNQSELDFWRGPLSKKFHFAHVIEDGELEYIYAASAEGRLRVVSDTEIITPGITAVWVGGHTPGQMVLIVETKAGSLILASDAIHLYEELELDRPFSIVSSLPDAYQALDVLRRLDESESTTIVAGHDPRVFEVFPSVDGSNIAVKLG